MWRLRRRRLKQLQQLGKPFVMLLNSLRPYNQETKKLAERLEETYHCAVIPVNCEQLKKEDIHSILEKLLYEFPVTRINFDIPNGRRCCRRIMRSSRI